MDPLVDAIKSAVPHIVQNYNKIPKEVLPNLICEVSSKKLVLERLYLMHCLMESLSGFHEIEVVKFFSTLLPNPLSPDIADFMTHFVSLAVSLENRQILAAGSLYLDSDQISFPQDLESLPMDMVSKSPHFAAVVVSKGFFNTIPHLFPPELLIRWVQDLSRLPDNERIAFDAKKLLEYAFIGQGRTHSNLHLCLLEVMERKRIQAIPCEFMLSLAQNIVSHPEDKSSPDVTVDRFCQILLVSLESKVCSKFTPEVKQIMAQLFASNHLLLLILSAMN